MNLCANAEYVVVFRKTMKGVKSPFNTTVSFPYDMDVNNTIIYI